MKKLFVNCFIILFLLLCSNSFGQTNFCKQDICVVEFNAYWNKDNSPAWIDSLENCGITRILITDKKMLADVQKKYQIQNVPTIIIFQGEEVGRFQACLRFKIGETRKEVQDYIDKFNETDSSD